MNDENESESVNKSDCDCCDYYGDCDDERTYLYYCLNLYLMNVGDDVIDDAVSDAVPAADAVAVAVAVANDVVDQRNSIVVDSTFNLATISISQSINQTIKQTNKFLPQKTKKKQKKTPTSEYFTRVQSH